MYIRKQLGEDTCLNRVKPDAIVSVTNTLDQFIIHMRIPCLGRSFSMNHNSAGETLSEQRADARMTRTSTENAVGVPLLDHSPQADVVPNLTFNLEMIDVNNRIPPFAFNEEVYSRRSELDHDFTNPENGRERREPEMTLLRNFLSDCDSPTARRRAFSTGVLHMSDFSSILQLPSRRAASPKPGLEGSLRARYHWALIRQYICCIHAIRGDKRKPWVQLAGHKDSFQTGEVGTILKKLCPEEHHCLRQLTTDALKPFVPLYLGSVVMDGQEYIEMRDLLTGFDPSVSVMDCKMGVRTYLEDELVKAKENPKMRPDMYQKMIELDRNAPTPEEHAKQAVTKPRYMQWRETLSSSATMGFRIEGIKKADGFSSKDFKFTKSRSDVLTTLRLFTEKNCDALQLYVHRLKDLRRALLSSRFFASHEVVGCSLLFIHDKNGLGGVWMIDFAKTVPLPLGCVVDHVKPWVEGNHEDGFLFGLNNLISCFEELLVQSWRKS